MVAVDSVCVKLAYILVCDVHHSSYCSCNLLVVILQNRQIERQKLSDDLWKENGVAHQPEGKERINESHCLL